MPDNDPIMINDQQFMIIMSQPRVGLFASLIQVLGTLYYCKENNIIPVVFFGNNWVYWETGGYNLAINGWEYYFSPVSEYSVTDIIGMDDTYLESCNIFDFDEERIIINQNTKHMYDLSRRGHIILPTNVTVTNIWPAFHLGKKSFLEERRTIAHELISKFITVHPNIVEKVDDFYKQYFKGKTIIGVHMRGRERNTEVEDWHGLVFAHEYYYMKEVDAFLDCNPDALVLVSTDTEVSLERFKKKYNRRCLYYNAKRSSESSSPHLEFGGAKVGEEMLIEGLLLARTDFFVHGISNVANGVLCFNPILPHMDIYQKHEKKLASELLNRNKLLLNRVIKKLCRIANRYMG